MASSSHNSSTSAVKGGMGPTATPANSGGSGLFGGSTVGATNDAGSIGPAGDGGRRASQEQSGSRFGNLSSLKRNSGDMGRTDRKNSLSDQNAKPGMIYGMFNKLTKGGETK